MQALVGAGSGQSYRAEYRITGTGSTGESLVVAQLPPRGFISAGSVAVYTSSAASDQTVPLPVPGAVVCRTPASGAPTCSTEQSGRIGAAELIGLPVSRGSILAMLEQDAQLIEQGNPGGMLRSVTRTHEVVAGQPSTCLHAMLTTHIQTVCTTTTGIPTLVVQSATTATLVDFSPAVPESDLVPPVPVTTISS
jgi:hypothetical protein